MGKQYDLSIMGIGTIVTSNNVFDSEKDRFNGIVSDEKLANHLAAITTSDKASDALGIAKAYHCWCVTKEDARREKYKNETELLMALTGLGKSSISQLRMVGAFFADDNGAFYVPEQLKGYTTSQIYEVLAKCKGIENPADFATITKEKGITCATSTKAIRAAFDPLTKEERAGVNKSKAVKAARNKLANDGVVLEVVDNDDNVVMEVAILSVIENIDESIMKAVQEESLRLHI
jgi:hypothetical protein